jgi:hypothetical protein
VGRQCEFDAAIAPLDELFERMIGQSCVEAFVDSERSGQVYLTLDKSQYGRTDS